MLLVALSAPLLLRSESFLTVREHLLAVAAFFSVATFGPSSMYLYAQRHLYPDWTRRLWAFPALLVFGTGIALNNTAAILEALFRIRGAFIRTPKFRIESRSDTWVGKRYRAPVPWLSLLEALLALYCLYGVSLFLQRGRVLIDPFLVLYCIGFATVAGMSVWESLRNLFPQPTAFRRPLATDDAGGGPRVRRMEEPHQVTAAGAPAERTPVR